MAVALTLLRWRARTSIVRLCTGLPVKAIQKLYYDLHNERPVSGRLVDATVLIHRDADRIHVALFATHYQRLVVEGRDRCEALILAYDLYSSTAPVSGMAKRLDINAAWAITRSMHAGLAHLQPCRRCMVVSLSMPHAHLPPECPCCGHRGDRSALPVRRGSLGEVVHCQATASGPQAAPSAIPSTAPVKGLRTVSDIQRLDLAVELIRRRARPPIVQVCTGLPWETLRSIYIDLHGTPPPRGQMLMSAASLLTSRSSRAHVALYARLYCLLSGGHLHLEPRVLLKAYDLYLSLAPPGRSRLDINAAWIIVRDLRAGLATLRPCRRCRARFLVASQDTKGMGCPFCAALRPTDRIRPRRTSSRVDGLWMFS